MSLYVLPYRRVPKVKHIAGKESGKEQNMASGTRPRRKCVSVSFVRDDDVIQHVVNVEDKQQGKKQTGRRRASHQTRLKYQQNVDLDEDEEKSDNEEEKIHIPNALEVEEGKMVGSDVFQFRTPKKAGQMAQKASEAKTPKTPKSILKSTNRNTETPEKSVSVDDKSTPAKHRRSQRIRLHKKPETTTPYKLRKRNEVNCSDSESSMSSSSSDESEEEIIKPDSTTNRTPLKVKTVVSTQKPEGGTTKKRAPQTVDVTSMVEEYFDIHSNSAIMTSDRTLAKLGSTRMNQEALGEILSKVPPRHSKECTQMYQEHRALFNKWMFQMCNGFNMLLYGLGSKRTLLEDFRKTVLQDLSHVVVNGYFPSLTIKHILNTITDDILEHAGSFKGPLDQVEFIRKEMDSQGLRDFYLIIHNIDGTMLRGQKSQNILSLLCQIPGFHILASIDHINAPLIWDQTKCSRFNWLSYDVTTYMPYSDETSYENSLLVQQSGALALSSMTHVMKSLTPNAKNIFMLLAKHQLENKDNGVYIGMSLHDLYQRCREGFLVNSDLTLQAQLIEFRDHKLIKMVKSFDGIEHLRIPIDNGTLTEFVEQQEEL